MTTLDEAVADPARTDRSPTDPTRAEPDTIASPAHGIPDLAELVARRRPGHVLEGPFYTSPEVFDLDLDAIFAAHWIFVATEPEIPEAGDYLTIDLGRDSDIVQRDDDG